MFKQWLKHFLLITLLCNFNCSDFRLFAPLIAFRVLLKSQLHKFMRITSEVSVKAPWAFYLILYYLGFDGMTFRVVDTGKSEVERQQFDVLTWKLIIKWILHSKWFSLKSPKNHFCLLNTFAVSSLQNRKDQLCYKNIRIG